MNAEHRPLPMVEIDDEYLFDGPDSEENLHDLVFGGVAVVLLRRVSSSRVG